MALMVSIATPLICGSTLFPGDATVLLNGSPIALVGDSHHCWRCGRIGTVLPLGTPVFVNGREVATSEHLLSCCFHPIGTGELVIEIDA